MWGWDRKICPRTPFSITSLTGLPWTVCNVPDCICRRLILLPYFRGDWSWNNFYVNSPPFRWFKKGCCQFQTVVSWTDHPDMIITVVCLFVWLDSLRSIINISVIKGQVFLVWTNTKLGLMCLAPGHNAVTPVKLESGIPWSRVKNCTTEPLSSLYRCWLGS